MSHSHDSQTGTHNEPVLEQGVPAVEKEQPSATEELAATHQTTCCIVGGGPGGVLLAYLLARQGVPVMLLEAHKDFDREFRGDTLHSAVLELLDDMGVANRLHQLPHSKAHGLEVLTDDEVIRPVDFRLLRSKYPYVMLLPQVDFLNFMTEEASQYPEFTLTMGANVQRLVEEDGVVKGVRYRAEDGWHEVRATVTVGADGRFSRLRHLAGIEPVTNAPPLDILWFKVPYDEKQAHLENLQFHVGAGVGLVILPRRQYLQMAYVFPKGRYQKIKKQGLDSLKQSIVTTLPNLVGHLEHLQSWRDFMLLSVESSRCPQWYKDGLLLIGDAAHVMTPIGGVGINYAIFDAVETANILAQPLKTGTLQTDHLRQVQERRESPTRWIQWFQSQVQRRILADALRADRPFRFPWLLRVLLRLPFLRSLPARMIGVGFGRPRLRMVKDNTSRNEG